MAKKAVSKAVLMNCILSIWSFMYWGFSPAQGFNVGLRGTACSVENDPCRSLYEAICDGAHCKCPSGSHEDKNMKRCVKGQAPAGAGAGGDDLFDLPLDYVPGEKPKDKPKPAKEEGTRGGQSPPTGSRDPPRTFGFNVGVRGTSCSLDKYSGSDSCRSLYDAICDGAHCKCPAGSHEDTNLKRCVKGRGGTREDDSFDLPLDYVPGDKPKDKPKTIGGGGGGGQVPSSDPDKSQPYYPSPPAVPRPHHPQPQTPKEDPHIGEKAGGGVGGGIGLLLLIGLVYFCCCRGEKGKNLLSKLPFGGGGQNEQSTTYAMQQQQTHVDPGQNPGTPPPAGV